MDARVHGRARRRRTSGYRAPVDNEYDHGPIVRKPVPIRPDDTRVAGRASAQRA
jgi:hypothetical protein